MRTMIVLGGLACCIATAAVAQQRVKESIISDAAKAAWTFDGSPKVKGVSAPAGVPGGQAVQVAIAQKGARPWDVQARLPMKDGVTPEDTVTFGFYARAAQPDPGKDTATVNIRFQRNAAPYDAALEGPVAIGKDWTFVCLVGPSKLALSAAEFTVSVQLAGDKHVIEFGPYMATKIPAQGPNIKSGLPCGKPIAAS